MMGNRYSIYTPLIETYGKMMRKAPLPGFKKLDKFEKLSAIINYSQQDMTQTLEFAVMAEEFSWTRLGGKVIFPEDEQVLRNLLRARFDIGRFQGAISLPFESFILAMPRDFRVEGLDVPLPSCIVTAMPFRQLKERLYTPFFHRLGLPAPDELAFGDEDLDERQLSISISYVDPKADSKLVRGREMIPEHKLPGVLEAESIEKFAELMGSFNQRGYQHALASDDYDLVIQFNLLKIVAALAVYNLATDGEKLVEGMPGTTSRKQLDGFKPGMKMVASTLSGFAHGGHESPAAHLSGMALSAAQG